MKNLESEPKFTDLQLMQAAEMLTKANLSTSQKNSLEEEPDEHDDDDSEELARQQELEQQRYESNKEVRLIFEG